MNVIAIDGPAGSGKSSTAKAVAARLGFAHLDSGALYRAFTMAALEQDLPDDGIRIAGLADALPIRLDFAGDGFRPEVAGVDVSRPVRAPAVTARVSRVAALPAVRDAVNQLLRAAAALAPRGVVMDGRDIGTVVFPEAALKVFLVASPEERARRRLLQDGHEPSPEAVAREAAALEARDAQDRERSAAPLKEAAGALRLDTTAMVFDRQVETIVAQARKVFPSVDMEAGSR
ncbi:MAG: (d)CMP kinase [Gemmatimonadales bacterium]